MKGYALVGYSSEEGLPLFNKMLEKLIHTPFGFEKAIDGAYLYSFEDPKTSMPIFTSSFMALCEDNESLEKALILPTPSPIFFSLLPYAKEKEASIVADVLLQNPELIEEMSSFLDGVDQEDIEAALAYCQNSSSPAAAALSLYCHKNTVTNRVKKFKEETNLDLSLFPNQLFLYLVGKDKKKAL